MGNGKEEGVGGLRLILKKNGEVVGLETVLRTFSDGGFYALGLLPGEYTIQIDPQQLEFMDAVSDPQVLGFEVEALADGDYKENLNFTLRPMSTERESRY